MFLSSQWQRSPSVCPPSSPHHASKSHLVTLHVFKCAFIVSCCNGVVFLLQMDTSGSTAGRPSRRATAARSCAPTDPTTRRPSAERQTQTDGRIYQKLHNHVFSPRATDLIFYGCTDTAGTVRNQICGAHNVIYFCSFMKNWDHWSACCVKQLETIQTCLPLWGNHQEGWTYGWVGYRDTTKKIYFK